MVIQDGTEHHTPSKPPRQATEVREIHIAEEEAEYQMEPPDQLDSRGWTLYC